jgi:hypothetical protein
MFDMIAILAGTIDTIDIVFEDTPIYTYTCVSAPSFLFTIDFKPVQTVWLSPSTTTFQESGCHGQQTICINRSIQIKFQASAYCLLACTSYNIPSKQAA